jgi:hypothetical protein
MEKLFEDKPNVKAAADHAAGMDKKKPVEPFEEA